MLTNSGWRVCIVEDDDKLARLLESQLAHYGFDTCLIKDFQHIDEEVMAYEPHLTLLDINLPFYDGFYWCRLIRRFTKTPIVFLSARTGNMDKVLALENGGDDYVTKPFDVEVLLAKIRALLRRTFGEYAEEVGAVRDKVVKDGLVLDLRRLEVSYQGQSMPLTNTELNLLQTLLMAGNQAVTRDELLSTVWDDAQFIDDNTLTVNITRLRAKLSRIGLPDVILTVRGVGYRLEFEGRDAARDHHI